MGLFKSFKKMLAPIGGAVGFALGGPMGAALGSGIGSLAGGGDIEDALLAGALGGAAGFAGQKFFGLTQAPAGATGIAKLLPGRQMVTGYDSALGKAIVESKPMMGIGSTGFGGKALPADKGIFSMFDDMSMGTKLGLGAGALALAGGMFGEEEEEKGGIIPIDIMGWVSLPVHNKWTLATVTRAAKVYGDTNLVLFVSEIRIQNTRCTELAEKLENR